VNHDPEASINPQWSRQRRVPPHNWGRQPGWRGPEPEVTSRAQPGIMVYGMLRRDIAWDTALPVDKASSIKMGHSIRCMVRRGAVWCAVCGGVAYSITWRKQCRNRRVQMFIVVLCISVHVYALSFPKPNYFVSGVRTNPANPLCCLNILQRFLFFLCLPEHISNFNVHSFCI
jgi:hypothetical protein